MNKGELVDACFQTILKESLYRKCSSSKVLTKVATIRKSKPSSAADLHFVKDISYR